MIKRLSHSSHWVYTGIAVLKVKTKKYICSFEKTKVYVRDLSWLNKKSLKRWFSKKIAGFDIEGPFGLGIYRIEGCFYNLLGLPLNKISLLLKRFNIHIFLLLMSLLGGAFIGCATEYNIATGRQEWIIYSTEKEVKIGKSLAYQIDKKYKTTEDILLIKRVKDIGERIVKVCDRKEIEYHFKVIEEKQVNAFALPGGFVYVNTALLKKVSSDDELAGVLAHEVAHIVARHGIKKLQAMMGYTLLRIATASTSAQNLGRGLDLAFLYLLSGYSQEDELLADRLAVTYMIRAGYNPEAMISFLHKLYELQKRSPLRPKSYLRTHPYISQRIKAIKQCLGKNLDFKDYINTLTR
jgi:predicted Zn-dependent protease